MLAKHMLNVASSDARPQAIQICCVFVAAPPADQHYCLHTHCQSLKGVADPEDMQRALKIW